MPITPAHAVVALPFVRTPLLPAAIAIGAMAPDLPLFLRGTVLTYDLTHTNVVVTGLLALALLALWYAVVRPAVRELSPAWLARRLPEEWDATGLRAWNAIRAPRRGAQHAVWRDPLVFGVLVVLSTLLGVVSHIVWDAFTHADRWGVGLVPALDEEWGPLLGFKWLQYGSGVLGLGVLGWYAIRWLSRREVGMSVERVLPAAVRWVWMLALPAALVVGWLIGLAALGPFTETMTPHHLAYRALPPALAVWGALTLGVCVLVLARRRR